ncbi:MAG: adenylyltransferase/cytidyltransferase family protein [Promethearchaeota archaeon]
MKLIIKKWSAIIRKVFVAGTFDIIQPGHTFFINEAAKLGEVYAIVATDKNRERISGKLPIISEEQRLEVIKNLKNVKKAKLGTDNINILLSVSEINPDIILLGPDQRFDIKRLKEALKKMKLGHIEVKRLNKYYDKYKLNSSSMIKKKIIESNDNKDSKLKREKANYSIIYEKI